MTKDSKITMDTVRLALSLRGYPDLIDAVRDVAELERLARRVKSLNTQYANTGGESVDRAADRASDKAAKFATGYGAKFSRYGRGSGLWPFVETSDGKDFSL